jgi:preprotein translocase subunit SecB
MTANGNDAAQNGDGGNGAEATELSPSIHVQVQYLKDFSFENPNAPTVFQNQMDQPQINVSVNVNAHPLDEKQQDFEVELEVEAKAESGEKVVFATELVYAGIFHFENVPADSLQAVVLIECPRLLFPFVRQIISDATRNGGFPPLLLDPIDFARLYQERMMQMAAETGADQQA